MPYEDRRCLLGGVEVRDDIATVGEMGYDSVSATTTTISLTHPITTYARATKLVGWGLCRSAWASPAAARHVLRAPEVAAAVGAHFLLSPSPNRTRWGPTAVALARQSRVAFRSGLPCWLPLPIRPFCPSVRTPPTRRGSGRCQMGN